jgi:hypothetical protein
MRRLPVPRRTVAVPSRHRIFSPAGGSRPIHAGGVAIELYRKSRFEIQARYGFALFQGLGAPGPKGFSSIRRNSSNPPGRTLVAACKGGGCRRRQQPIKRGAKGPGIGFFWRIAVLRSTGWPMNTKNTPVISRKFFAHTSKACGRCGRYFRVNRSTEGVFLSSRVRQARFRRQGQTLVLFRRPWEEVRIYGTE